MTIDTIFPIDAISRNARRGRYMRQLFRNGKGSTLCIALNQDSKITITFYYYYILRYVITSFLDTQ